MGDLLLFWLLILLTLIPTIAIGGVVIGYAVSGVCRLNRYVDDAFTMAAYQSRWERLAGLAAGYVGIMVCLRAVA